MVTEVKTRLGYADLVDSLSCTPRLNRPGAYLEPHWYAARTRANHERLAYERLLQRSVDSFLPTYASVRRWKDRHVHLQIPLFPGYLFVNIALGDRLRVLEVPGVTRLVSFNGKPVALNETEIGVLRRAFAEGTSAQPHPYIAVGRRVRVISGPFRGAEGLLVKQKSNFRVIISIELIMRSAIIEVSAADIEPVVWSQTMSDGT